MKNLNNDLRKLKQHKNQRNDTQIPHQKYIKKKIHSQIGKS